MEEKHLLSLLENLPGMAYRCDNNREWKMRYVTVGVYELTGYHADDLIESRSVAYEDLIHPEDRSSVWTHVQNALAGNHSFEMEYRIRTAAGREKWVWERGKPVRGETGAIEAIEGFITDISAHKMTLEVLAQNRQFMKTIMAEVQAVIFSFDSGGIFTFSDGKGLQALGLKPGQVVGLSVFDVYRDMPDIKDSCHRALSGEVVRSKGMEVGLLILDTIYQPVFDLAGKVCSVVGIAVDVTELKNTQEDLLQKQRFIETVINNVQAIIFAINPQGFFTYSGGKELETIGVKPGQSVGKSIFDLHRNLPEVHDAFRKALRGEVAKTSDMEVAGILFDSIYQPVFDEEHRVISVTGISMNVAEQRKQQNALRETRDYLENLIGYANAPIIVWTPQYRITRFNAAFEALTGRRAEEVLGGPLDILFPEEQVDRSMSLIRETLSGDRWESVEIEIQHVDRSVRTVLWNSATILDKDGLTPVATIAQGQDITARKEVEKGLARALEEVNRSNRELEQFAYVASHDLQEPLRMVSSFTQLLSQRYADQLDDKARKYIEYAVDGAVRMQRLINDLLTYSRVNTQGGSPSRTDAGRVLGEALHNLSSAIGESGAIISSGMLPEVQVDPTQLLQLFQNLLSNAIKFRAAETPEIRVTACDAGSEWMFSVKDNGIGIDPKYADRIFVIFQRLHTRREYPGTGVGLAVCKRIVERHGGKIWYASTAGSGTTFYFTLRK